MPTRAAYDRPVPRYTSFPTAAQFHGGVGPVEHRAWLQELALNGATMADATLYLHVPFCARLCWYCACHTSVVNRPESLEAYARALTREIDLVAAEAPDLKIGSIQWGGGTPSQLGPARLAAVARHLAARFERRDGSETSMELDPRFCDEALAATLREIGVDRVSFGIQDFDVDVQQAINRPQSFDETMDAMDRLSTVGIDRFNLDLVYGLPRQTCETLERTLDLVLDLGPDRIAVFAYAHVPWMKPRQGLIAADTLPGLAERAEMAMLVSDSLLSAGYLKVGLDHYALPTDPLARAAGNGRLRRSFQGYVAETKPWVVGLGASAISTLPSGYTQNTADARRYGALIDAGCFATTRGYALSAADRLRGEIIERLMCGFAVDLGEVCGRHGVSSKTFVAEIEGLPALIDDGLVRCKGDRLEVTPFGQPLVRFVCAAFDHHLRHTDGRHSRGI